MGTEAASSAPPSQHLSALYEEEHFRIAAEASAHVEPVWVQEKKREELGAQGQNEGNHRTGNSDAEDAGEPISTILSA